MTEPQGAASPGIAARVRRLRQAVHRELVFWRGMRRFLRDPRACTDAASPVLQDLIYGWGNPHWSAREEFLAACVGQALATRGPILECGSGISTLLIGAIAKQRGLHLWALEHRPEWAAKLRRSLDRYRLDSVVLCTTPLRAYGAFHWYDPPLESMPDRFSLVVCDGPPGNTKGGRYGMVPIMRKRLEPGCVILLDDAERQAELVTAGRWQAELGGTVAVVGSSKPFVELRLGGAPAAPR